MKEIHRMRERKPRRKFLNLRHAISQAITVITHLSRLTVQTSKPVGHTCISPILGAITARRCRLNSLQAFYLLDQLRLSQSRDRTQPRERSPLAAAIVRPRRFPHAPDLSCPVKLRPLKYRAVSVRSFSATVKRAKPCPLLQREVFHCGAGSDLRPL